MDVSPHTSSSRPLPRINFGTFSDEKQTFAKRKKEMKKKRHDQSAFGHFQIHVPVGLWMEAWELQLVLGPASCLL